MKNVGASFVKIMEFVAACKEEPGTNPMPFGFASGP